MLGFALFPLLYLEFRSNFSAQNVYFGLLHSVVNGLSDLCIKLEYGKGGFKSRSYEFVVMFLETTN